MQLMMMRNSISSGKQFIYKQTKADYTIHSVNDDLMRFAVSFAMYEANPLSRLTTELSIVITVFKLNCYVHFFFRKLCSR